MKYISSFKPITAGEKVEIILKELPQENLKSISNLSGKIIFAGQLSNNLSGDFTLTTKAGESPSHFVFAFEFSEENEIVSRELDLISK